MNRINRKIQLVLLPMFLTLGCLLLSSCFNDDYEDVTSGISDKASICLHISTNAIGDLNATRADDDDIQTQKGSEGEFINTLCVFIVNADTRVIEAKVQPVLDDNDLAKGGNLEEYTSGTLEISTGEKVIYAFANWDYAGSEEWNRIIAKGVGDNLEYDELDIKIEAAQNVDIENGKFIPMSVEKKDVYITYNDLNNLRTLRTIEVTLVRLVSKVEIIFNGITFDEDDEQELKIDTLSFSGAADKVQLISGNGSNVEDFNQSVKLSDITITKEGSNTLSFYINESDRRLLDTEGTGATGFDIYLAMEKTGNYNDYDGTVFTAVTPRSEIERNYIYPIELNLDNYSVTYSVEAYTAPIGLEEIPYTTDATWNDVSKSYLIELRDITSSFTITPTLYHKNSEGTTTVSDSDVEWEVGYENGDELEYEINDNIITFSNLTATIGYTYEFTLTAMWTDSSGSVDLTHTRTYNFKVELTEGNFSIDDKGSYQ